MKIRTKVLPGDRFAVKSNLNLRFDAIFEPRNGGSAADVWARWCIVIRLHDAGEQALGFLLAHAPRGNYNDEPDPVQRALDGLTHGLSYPGPDTVYWSIEGREYEEDGTPQEYDNPRDPITNLWLDAGCPGGDGEK